MNLSESNLAVSRTFMPDDSSYDFENDRNFVDKNE